MLSWHRPGAAIHAIQQMEKSHMDITAVQEVRWPDSGNVKMSKSVVFFSGSPNNRHEFGTGFVIAERMVGSLISFRPISEGICYIRVKGKWYNFSFISAHAPTEEKDEETKDIFYDQLEQIITEVPQHDMLILCGDFNAKIGKEQFLRPHIGQHSLHDVSNENGLRLVEMAAANNMLIKSTMFQHKEIHKQTWVSNDGRTRNQIDHIVVDARHGSNVIDVRSLRGPDADTDHFLVKAKVRARVSMQKNYTTVPKIKWNTDKLSEESTNKRYIQCLDSQLELAEESEDIDNSWQTINKAITKAADNVLGKQPKNKHKTWFDEECKKILEERNRARQSVLQRRTDESIRVYSELRGKARKLMRTKKRQHDQRRLEEMERDSNHNRSKKFYKEITNTTKGFRPRAETILGREDGSITTNKDEIVNEWKQYFDKLLNINQRNAQTTTEYQTVEPQVEQPTYEEIIKAIKKLKNNKAPGKDNIPAELLKYGGEALHRQLHRLITLIWSQEKIPEEWKESLIIPIHKKGDRTKCSNYRGISLINTAYKILANILLERLKPIVESGLGDYQCGFRKNRSTVDQIFTVRQMLEKCWEFNRVIHQLFIDFRQAYDSILRVKLWDAMVELGIPKKLIKLTSICVNGSRSRVKVGEILSDSFEVSGGLKQGDSLSPMLFNIALEKAIRAAELTTEVFGIDGPRVLLAFADDIDVVGNTVIMVKELFNKIEGQAEVMGLKINEDKTKYMYVGKGMRRDRIGQNVTMGEYNFERVTSFRYLGATISEENSISDEVKIRIQSGCGCMYALKQVITSKNLSRRSKIKVYKTVIRPVVMYGSETWTLTKENERKLKCFERKVLRKIFGPYKDPRTEQFRPRTNNELTDLYEEPDIIKVIKAGRLRWAGHVHRQPDSRVIKMVWEQNPEGRRSLGRPRMRWRDNIVADLRAMGIEYDPELMQDRERWRMIVQSAKTHQGL